MPNKARRIKNWEKFQHYQDGKRKPEWIKVYRDLLNDIEWHQLDGKDAKVLVMLWMLASENGGSLPPIKTIAFRLRLSEKEINSILSRLPHWVDQSASEALADCYQSDSLEEEGEENKNERGAKRATQVPSDWKPKPETISLLKTKSHSDERISAELEKFRDFHISRGTPFKDIDAGFRVWMTKAKEYAASRGGARTNGSVATGSFRPQFKPEPEVNKPPPEEREAQVARLISKGLTE